jgi:hypothetical protein
MFAMAVLLVSAPSALADTFQFSYSGSGVSVSGLLNATPVGGGMYIVTSISGTRNGQPITGLFPCSPIPPATYCANYGYNYDNLFFPTAAAQFDLHGLVFGVQGLTNPINLYWEDRIPTPVYMELTWVATGGTPSRLYTYTPVDFSTVAVVPEPSTVLLFGSGLLAVAGAIRRKWLGK